MLHTIHTLPSSLREALIDAAADAHEAVARAVADWTITAEEGVSELQRILAEVLDAAVPTGPLDPHDDQAIENVVRGAIAWLREKFAELLARNPARIRRRAARVEAEDPEHAARLYARADRIEARQAKA